MSTMTSMYHNLPGGDALSNLVLHTMREIEHPCNSKELTTTILGVSKGARGWYETNARIRHTLRQLEHSGCVERASKDGETPISYRYVRDLSVAKSERNPDRKSVPPGLHRIQNMIVEVNDKSEICKVVSDTEVYRRIPRPHNTELLERVEVVGLHFGYVRSQLRRKEWEIRRYARKLE